MSARSMLFYTFSQIRHRKFLFLLSMVSLCMAFLYTDMELYNSLDAGYCIMDAGKALGKNRNTAYRISFGNYSDDEGTRKKEKKFADSLYGCDGITEEGGFYRHGYVLNEIQDKSKTEEELMQDIMSAGSVSILGVSSGLAGLCGLDFSGAEEIWKKGRIPLYAGADYRDEVRKGMVLTSEFSEKDYEVAGILEPESKWIDISELGSEMGTVSLDSCFVRPVFETDTKDETAALLDSLYVTSTLSKEELYEKIKPFAEKAGVNAVLYSFPDMVRKYKKANSETLHLALLIMLAGLAVSLVSVFLTACMEARKNQKEYIIMRIHGVPFRSIGMIVFLENAVRMFLPFLAAHFISCRIISGQQRWAEAGKIQFLQGMVCIIMFLLVSLSLAVFTALVLRSLSKQKPGEKILEHQL